MLALNETKVYWIDLTFLEIFNGKVVRATPLVLNMMPCKLKIDEKSQNMSVWCKKMVLAQHFCTFC
jgi:hypothetical protein